MKNDLLFYYNRELSAVRELGAEFAEANPKIAGRLRLGRDAAEDPHVERLIQAFAYLNARTRRKLDDDFPELTGALLGVLYPHYLRPVPSMAIVQFQPQTDITEYYDIPVGTHLETDPIDGEPCQFQTTYPVKLLPIEIAGAKLHGRPFTAPVVDGTKNAEAVLKLSLRCMGSDIIWKELAPDSLRFFIDGQAQIVYPLYELIFNNLVQVAICDEKTQHTVKLGVDCVRPVGFDLDEGMLPYPARSFVGYRLLTEFFVFPQKFLFFDVGGLDEASFEGISSQLDFYFYFNRGNTDLEDTVNAKTFMLGCAPIVNLYRQRVEPINLDHSQYEYRIIPDVRRPDTHEIYSVEKVMGEDENGDEKELLPFYGLQHSMRSDNKYWNTNRRSAGQRDSATDLFISVSDLELDPVSASGWVLDIETLCLNRNLPNRLPFGGGQPYLTLTDGMGKVEKIDCVTSPTPTRRIEGGNGGRWRLMSHLLLNHLSITDETEGTFALQEILKLYDFEDSDQTRAMIQSVASVTSRPVTGRVADGKASSLCRGTEINIEFDETGFTGSGMYLFAAVLERFLALYCSVNSFTRLQTRIKGREGIWCKWPPKSGDHTLL